MNSLPIFTLLIMAAFAMPLEGEESRLCLSQNEESKKPLKPGSSIDTPILFEGVKDIAKVRAMENEYLQKNYPDYNIVSIGTSPNKYERSIMTVQLEMDGERISVFFDEEEATIEYGKKNAKRIDSIVDRALKKQNKEGNNDELPGTSFSSAILLKNARTSEEVDQQEREFLKKYYPDYQIIGKEIWFVEKKFLDRIKVKKEDEQETVNFDISSFIKKYKNAKQLKFKELYPKAYLVEMPSPATDG